jgi:hypothetical protein
MVIINSLLLVDNNAYLFSVSLFLNVYKCSWRNLYCLNYNLMARVFFVIVP